MKKMMKKMMKKKGKKAFTLIELIVVIAVVGILVLLGAPRFIGYTQRAELARIQHDTKVMEQEIGTMLINNDDDFNEWENNSKDFNQLIQENKLFDREGVIEEIEDLSTDKTYKVTPEEYKDKINTKLKGTFYANNGGKVYYEHVKPLFEKSTGSENPTGPENPAEPEEEEPGHSDENVNNKEGLMNPIESRKSTEEEIAIATADELAKIGEPEYPVDGKYILTANIDLSGYSEGEGWTPIGTSSSRFKGSFNGNGYKITGLTINRPTTDNVGLFGYTQGATIENVALEDINVTGQHSVGGLVGYAFNSNISNSYAEGSVTGVNQVGGLVGYVWTSAITNSYATGSVKGSGERVGGLVGSAYKSTITNSYSTGSATGPVEDPSKRYVGGLVGYASGGTISNSYATGSVTGASEVGGLVGGTSENTITNSYATGSATTTGNRVGHNRVGGLVGYASGSTIDNSYATGEVNGAGQLSVRGLVGSVGSVNVNGKVINSTITNSYWDTETTGQEESAGGVGKSTEEMKLKGTYEGWDFETVWNIVNGEYPTLR